MCIKKVILFFIPKQKKFFLYIIFCIFFIIGPKNLQALDSNSGQNIFKNHCAGCHINGGNIIRRSKNLKISSLKRNGIDNPESIAQIAREGIGIMQGYEDRIGDKNDQIVAKWIWEQAQNAWIQE